MKYEEFECIYQEYCLKILTFIHKRVPDLYEAEELTGDVFLSFYRNMDSYDEEKGSIATWLYAITANRLKNYYRDKKTHYSLEILKQQTIPREKMPEEIVAKIMREETLRKSLEQLSGKNTLIHRRDPMVKLLSCCVYLVCLLSLDRQRVGQMSAFFLYPVVVLALAEVPFGMVLRRSLVVLPFCLMACVDRSTDTTMVIVNWR